MCKIVIALNVIDFPVLITKVLCPLQGSSQKSSVARQWVPRPEGSPAQLFSTSGRSAGIQPLLSVLPQGGTGLHRGRWGLCCTCPCFTSIYNGSMSKRIPFPGPHWAAGQWEGSNTVNKKLICDDNLVRCEKSFFFFFFFFLINGASCRQSGQLQSAVSMHWNCCWGLALQGRSTYLSQPRKTPVLAFVLLDVDGELIQGHVRRSCFRMVGSGSRALFSFL